MVNSPEVITLGPVPAPLLRVVSLMSVRPVVTPVSLSSSNACEALCHKSTDSTNVDKASEKAKARSSFALAASPAALSASTGAVHCMSSENGTTLDKPGSVMVSAMAGMVSPPPSALGPSSCPS